MRMEIMQRLRKRMWEKKGQNTVEYLMMLAVIVGIVLLISKLFKGKIGDIFNQVMQQISGAVGTVGSSNN
ncbi:MAG: hypothetical protein AAB412_07020 [Elusimicrobiota bacterium]